MGGWNYFEDSPSPRAHWNHGPGDYDDRPSLSDLAAEHGYHYDPEEFEEQGYHEPAEGDRYLREPGFREEHRMGAILTQREQWPLRCGGSDPDFDRDWEERHESDWEHQREHEGAAEHDTAHYMKDWATDAASGKRWMAPSPGTFYNRDPTRGATVPHFVGGDPYDAISVTSPEGAGEEGARFMSDEDTGLGYPTIVRPSSAHGPKAHDVLRPLT